MAKLDPAIERGSYVVAFSFTDEDGESVIPTAIHWSLYNSKGQVVNGRGSVPVEEPAASIEILLSGDDLDPEDGYTRYLVVEATYNSDLGNNLPLRAEAQIPIVGTSGE